MHFSSRPYQRVAIERMLKSPIQLLALRMGAGKTAVTLLAIEELMFNRVEITKALVVAPLRVAELVWHTEGLKWDQTEGLRIKRVLGPAKARVEALGEDADIFVINRENFSWLVEELGHAWPFDCVVIDENRGFKDRASKSWQSLRAIRDKIKRLYILTGTPGQLVDLWPQIAILDRGARLGKSITAYREKYFVPDKKSGHVVYSWKIKPGAASEIHGKVSDIMLSVDSDLVLPARIDNYVQVVFDMKRYKEMKRDMVSEAIVATSAGILAGKLAQMANGAVYDEHKNVWPIHDAKLDALEEIMDQGEPVLCFTSYQHDQTRIKDRFPFARVFDGEQSLKYWQQGKIDLLLMHPASGGHGIDGLQLGGNVAVWFGLPFSLDLYEQANARLHRPGQRTSVVIHHLVSVGTIDERIVAILETKGDMQQALMDAVNELKEFK